MDFIYRYSFVSMPLRDKSQKSTYWPFLVDPVWYDIMDFATKET